MTPSNDTDDFSTIGEVIDRARAVLEPGAHAWAAAGAGQDVTLERNRLALNSLALVPRMGRDVSTIDKTTTIMGVPLATPVFLAPVGALALYDPDDALAAARSATRNDTSAMISTLTTSSWHEVAATAPGRHFFQIYVLGDRDWLAALVDEIDAYGYGGLCVTMDCKVIARRDRSLSERFVWGTPPEGTVNLASGWDGSWRARFTWKDLEWLCAQTSSPVMAKGIMCAEDARVAVDCGVRGIYVSNHGGRMVDHAISTIEVLAEIVDAVGPDIDVVVDSGFNRGADMCKALALGARAVGIGKLQCWALAAGGSEALSRTLEILGTEISQTMVNMGCDSLADLTPDLVRWSIPTS